MDNPNFFYDQRIFVDHVELFTEGTRKLFLDNRLALPPEIQTYLSYLKDLGAVIDLQAKNSLPKASVNLI